jgi:hypothetical protein
MRESIIAQMMDGDAEEELPPAENMCVANLFSNTTDPILDLKFLCGYVNHCCCRSSQHRFFKRICRYQSQHGNPKHLWPMM